MTHESTILVVDDDPDLRAAVADVLQEEGYRTLTAEHGRAALDLLTRMRTLPHLILLDVMMPVMDGLTFAAELRGLPHLARIPIVIFSAHADHERIAHSAGAMASVAKPLRLEELITAVETVLTEVGRSASQPPTGRA